MVIGDLIQYVGPMTYRRPKYGLIVELKEILGGHEVHVYFPNNTLVQIHSKYVGIV
mgnify:CR=1 FL=1